MARSLLVAAGWTLACSAFAQPGDPYPNTANFGSPPDRSAPWFQQCLRVEHAPVPVTPAKPASCAAYDYYDKLAQATATPAEWAGVRACAVAAHDYAILSMLFANGLGVARDLDVATQYACRDGGAPAEVEGRVAHLQAFKKSPPANRYDQCDDITSGYMMGICAGIAGRQQDKLRNADVARLRGQLTAPQAVLFDRLLAAMRAFAQARTREIDLSGTARGMQALEVEASEKDWLQEHLAACEQGHAKLPPPQQFAAQDAALNRAYQAVMTAKPADPAHPDRLRDSTATKTDVRAAQRLWLIYRDAWVRFAALRYPAIAADSLKADLTASRVKQLDGM